MQSPSKEVLAERNGTLNKAFDSTEKRLGDGPYFNGIKLGNVGIAWLPLLHRAQVIEDHSGYDLLEGRSGTC